MTVPATGWRRLDKRMLLVHPVVDAARQAHFLIAAVFVGSRAGHGYAELVGPFALLVVSLSRWVTTTYRLDGDNAQRRSGLVRREHLSVPLSRIRAVDVEATVVHRMLGLTVVKVRTAATGGGPNGQGMFELNGVSKYHVDDLRAQLLQRATDEAPGEETAPAEHRVLARLSPYWCWYAPTSSVGHVLSLGVLAPLLPVLSAQAIADAGNRLLALGAAAAVLLLLVTYALLSAGVAVAHYALAYGRLTVTEDTASGRLHIGYGLLKQVHRTLDRGRLRGASLKEPLPLRLVGGARLDAIMTGISGGTMLLPAAPGREARRLAHEVLGDLGPVTTRLRSHGAAARRRRWTRALLPVAVAAALLAVVRPSAWVFVALACVAIAQGGLAVDRYRGLGHAVLPGWLVTQSGSLTRRRDALHADGIIGWTVRQTWFQRRAGLVTVVAATPAGRHGYRVVDLPADLAWDLIDSATPGAGDIWLRRSGDGRDLVVA